jgi:hypothetical protein
MNDSTSTSSGLVWSHWVTALLPFYLFALGCVVFLYSVLTAIGESGDPPYTQNDNWQRAAIIACPALFIIATVCAAVARRRVSAAFIATAGTIVCLMGWDIVQWDIPTLFR